MERCRRPVRLVLELSTINRYCPLCLLFQHSCYDGSISASYQFWLMISLVQEPEPIWDDLPSKTSCPVELKFDLDDHLVNEIQSTYQEVEKTVSYDILMKTHKIQGKDAVLLIN